ncbi:S8 family peptidase [Ferruginibacter sp.]
MHRLLLTFLIPAFSFNSATAQKETTPNGWHMMDKEADGYYGVSSQKAYDFIRSHNLKSKTVIVAVIDTGIDTLHEDLKSVLWVNPREIPGNGIDDDKNGYIDDVHGWNFLGGKDGRNVNEDSPEAARIYYGLKTKYQGKEKEDIDPRDIQEYTIWQRAKANVMGEDNDEGKVDIVRMKKVKAILQKSDSILKTAIAKEVFSYNELNSFIAKEPNTKVARNTLLSIMKDYNQTDATNREFVDGFSEFVDEEEKKEAIKSNPPKNFRADVVKDDESNVNDRNYGNNDIMAGTPMHGTHTSGIIAAVRNNGLGVDGMADNVRIMMLRAVPDGDEHDKDIANAIRYAVDNGAQIISMSFGKYFSPHKEWVDDAFRYAESKNVLLVLAAGNDSKNLDNEESFPNPVYRDGKGKASNLLTVGASGDPKNGGLAAYFSNYGKNVVDVFAPGVKIYSTLPGGNNYGNLQGTSFACPLVAGIAALTLEYFPTLTPQQLKYVIERSALKPKYKVTKPGSDEMVLLEDISKTGGIANAYEALKVAATLKGDKKQTKEVLPKPKLISTKKG